MRISDWSSDVCSSDLQIARDYACTSCHALDDSRLVGPGWGGLYGSHVTLADGSTAVADDAFLVESILEPDAKVAAGYVAGTMPSYASQLDGEKIEAVVRSEEHTSELQSLMRISYAVFCLQTQTHTIHTNSPTH